MIGVGGTCDLEEGIDVAGVEKGVRGNAGVVGRWYLERKDIRDKRVWCCWCIRG